MDTKIDRSELEPIKQQNSLYSSKRHSKAMAELNKMMELVGDRLDLEAKRDSYAYAVATAHW